MPLHLTKVAYGATSLEEMRIVAAEMKRQAEAEAAGRAAVADLYE